MLLPLVEVGHFLTGQEADAFNVPNAGAPGGMDDLLLTVARAFPRHSCRRGRV